MHFNRETKRLSLSLSIKAQEVNLNSHCGPGTVVTLIAVVLNKEGVDGNVLVPLLASTRESVAILIHDSLHYFEQIKYPIFAAQIMRGYTGNTQLFHELYTNGQRRSLSLLALLQLATEKTFL